MYMREGMSNDTWAIDILVEIGTNANLSTWHAMSNWTTNILAGVLVILSDNILVDASY